MMTIEDSRKLADCVTSIKGTVEMINATLPILDDRAADYARETQALLTDVHGLLKEICPRIARTEGFVEGLADGFKVRFESIEAELKEINSGLVKKSKKV